MTNERPTPETAELVEALNNLVQRLTGHDDPRVVEDSRALLEGMDTLHRVGLTRLVEEVRAMAGDAFLNRLCQDPEIELLLMSYGLVSVSRTIQADEALDAVRPHLAAHGVAVKVLEVVGGVVYVRVDAPPETVVDVEAVRRDLETALREDFLGFQELQIGERPWSPPSGSLVQLEGSGRPRLAPFQTVAAFSDVRDGHLASVTPEGQQDSVLLLRATGEIRAFHNRCGDSPLPLHYSRLEDGVLVCSWHGCRYDAGSGTRIDQPDEPGLVPVPVRIVDGLVQVAMDMAGT